MASIEAFPTASLAELRAASRVKSLEGSRVEFQAAFPEASPAGFESLVAAGLQQARRSQASE